MRRFISNFQVNRWCNEFHNIHKPANNRFVTTMVQQLPVQRFYERKLKEPFRNTIFVSSNTFLQQQQLRDYVNVAKEAVECWNCKKVAKRKHCMICSKCGHLQDVETEINFFELLDFPQNFDIERHELTKRFRQLQTLVHPDKYSNKSAREQDNSADWSSLINKAYKTLLTPIDRGQYLLKLHGEQISHDNSALDSAFLMEMMERNEEVEEAVTNEDLERLNAEIVKKLNGKVIELGGKFQMNALDAAKAILIQMKYLLSVQKSIKTKLQTMFGSN